MVTLSIMNIPKARAAVNPSLTTMRSGARVSIAGRGVAALRSASDVTTRRMTSRVVLPAASARPLEPARAISPASEDQLLGTDSDKATYENTGQLQVRFFFLGIPTRTSPRVPAASSSGVRLHRDIRVGGR